MCRFAIASLLALAVSALPASAQEPVEHLLTTRDGVEIPAWAWGSGDEPWVLLFHQGGASGRAEYDPIVARVRAAGFQVLVIDQRRGGDRFGGRNAVADGFDPEETSYCDVRPDLEAALAFARAREPGRRVVLWGSSYSAALVIGLAADRPDAVAGVLAFSPASGDPMAGCEPEPRLHRLQAPLLAVRPASEMEIASVAEQLDRFRAAGAETWIADPGVHGSSSLVDERVGADTSATWAVVSRFLASVRPR